MVDRNGAVTFLGNPLTLSGNPVAVGERAPDFEAVRADLSTFRLSDERGKVVVISSVPSLDTPVCAMQARRFNQEAAALGEGVKVVVVSMDLPFAQKRFCATEGVSGLETVSDHRDATFAQAYGLLVKELRLDARAVLVVDQNGTLAYQQLVGEISHEPDYDAALAAARALSSAVKA